jgi:hypothetical protein
MALGLLGVACSFTPDRYHPDYQAYQRHIRRVLLLPPEISIVEESSEGAAVWQVSKSRVAQKHAREAVCQILTAKGYIVQMAGADSGADPREKDEIASIQTLYRSVNRSIQLHTYGPYLFPAKQRRFEYGIGSIRDLLNSRNADALVLVIGHQTLSSTDPKTWISIAVVEPGGALIWYGMQGARQNLNLEDPGGTLALIRQTLQPFGGAAS